MLMHSIIGFLLVFLGLHQLLILPSFLPHTHFRFFFLQPNSLGKLHLFQFPGLANLRASSFICFFAYVCTQQYLSSLPCFCAFFFSMLPSFLACYLFSLSLFVFACVCIPLPLSLLAPALKCVCLSVFIVLYFFPFSLLFSLRSTRS